MEQEKHGEIRLGIIGTGRIARRFVGAAHKAVGIGITCVYNPHAESAKIFAKENDIENTFDQWEDFLKLVDAVYIASPHNTHAEYAKMLLEEGKHVLCEKPMCLKAEETKMLYCLAEEKDLVLMEAVKTAYCPGFLALVEMAQSGKIGEIRDVEAAFTRLTPTNLREFTDISYGGSVTEFGSYVLLPIWKLLGTDYKKMSYQSLRAENGVDTYTKLFFTFENGMATAKTGLGAKSEGQLLVSGTKGYILAESPWWLTRKFEVRYEDPNHREVYEYPYEGTGLQYELEEFCRKIRACVENEENAPGVYFCKQERMGDNDSFHGQQKGITPRESIMSSAVMESFLQQESEYRKPVGKEQEQKVKIWAHRGCCTQYPENTLPAFETAAKLPQVTGVELDVQLTKDGHVVVFHDEQVSRVTDGTGKVVDYTLEELKQLYFKEAEGTGIRIPTLEEVLILLAPYCRQKGLQINIELKTSVIHYEGIEEKTLALVRKYEILPYIVFSSFWAESVKRVKELDPKAQTGMLAANLSDCIRWGRYAGVDALHPWIGGMDCKIPEDMKHMPVRAWNVEEPFYKDGRVLKERNLRKYAMFGVTEVFTNAPENYL